MKRYLPALLMLAFFECVAVVLWWVSGDIFYLFNFSYIGVCLSVGLVLYTRHLGQARRFVLLAVGLYMLVYLGIIEGENMQIEGFWYYLFLGVFQATTIHYAVAKIGGPFLFGRGWCGYACWTAMVLELLPYDRPRTHDRRRIGFIRYIVFVSSLVFVGALFIFHVSDLGAIMSWAFIVGNIVYYAVGVILAFVCKDNRAFCKYICPVTVFLKPASYLSVLRVKVDEELCTQCGRCTQVCPMDVEVPRNDRGKRNATECILCMKCVEACPVKALHL